MDIDSLEGGLRHGQLLSLPLTIENQTLHSAPVQVVAAWMRKAGSPPESVNLGWRDLAPRQSRRMHLHLGRLEAGLLAWELLAHCRTRNGHVQEDFMLGVCGEVRIGAQTSSVNIEIKDCTFGVGSTGILASSLGHQEQASPKQSMVRQMAMERSERYELELGVRGYRDLECRILRDVVVRHTGSWAVKDISKEERPFVHHAEIFMGRDRPGMEPQQFTSLRAYDQWGRIDELASKRVSRRQMAVRLGNDRLVVEALGQAPVLHNKVILPHGQERVLSHGDRLTIDHGTTGSPVEFTVWMMNRAMGSVKEVVLRREQP